MANARKQGLNRRRLSDEQAREIRLSMESHNAVARRIGMDATAINRLRSGLSYGPLKDDERAAHHRRQHLADHPDLFHLNEYLLVVGDQRVHGGNMDRQEMLDAVHECVHGRLSHDSSSACGCWPGELASVVVLPDRERKPSYVGRYAA